MSLISSGAVAPPRAQILRLATLVTTVFMCFAIFQSWTHQEHFTVVQIPAPLPGQDRLIDYTTPEKAPVSPPPPPPAAAAAEPAKPAPLASAAPPPPPPPPEKKEGIPKKIWYKLGPKGKSAEIEEWTNSCLTQNPDHAHEFMTDASADAYVARTFSATRPDIVEAYLAMTIPIVKADLLRYLLLYAEGGIWSDLDVSCEGIPIAEWVAPEYRDRADLVVGWEFDGGYNDSYIHEFASWTIMSKPGLSHMLQIVEDIVDEIHALRDRYNVPISGLTTFMVGDIVDFTGPRRMTNSIVKSLEKTLGRSIDRHEIEQIVRPVMMDNVLILPGYSFALEANSYDPAAGPTGPELVKHHYAGSWKNDYGGEQLEAKRRR